MKECRWSFFDTIRESNPRLNAEKLGVRFSNFLGRAFRMSDAASGGHPVNRARFNGLHCAETVSIQNLANRVFR
jgi:hypothetical protein